MGIYSTTTSINTRMIGVNFDSETTALVSTLITDAENEINKYLSRRYDLTSSYFQTSTAVPPLVKTLAARLAEAYAWEALSRGGKESLVRSKAMEKRAIDNLTEITNFKMNLLDTLGANITDRFNSLNTMRPDGLSSLYTIQCNTTDYSPTFDEGDETEWEVDPDKILDIEDAKD